MIRWGMTVEMLDLLTRLPVSGPRCVCHDPRVFGHQINCQPGRSIPMDLEKRDGAKARRGFSWRGGQVVP